MIRTFNSAVSNAINKHNQAYQAIFGSEDFIPEALIVDSSDFNCGALANELEFLKTVADYYIQSFDVDVAESDNLDALVSSLMDLPRRYQSESDSVYRNRFRSIAVQMAYPRRTTKWAILKSMAYFIEDLDSVQVIENFDSNNLRFEVRIEGGVDLTSAIFLDNNEQGYLDQNFVGGEGIGSIITFIGNIIERIKAAGVDFDILFIIQDRFTKAVGSTIGSVQKYFSVASWVQLVSQSTKQVDAIVIA